MPDHPAARWTLLTNIHASCVALEGQGVLLLGPSGAGKSDLALRLMDRGAALVADDRCDIFLKDQILYASAPENLAGLMEIRGLGIVEQPFRKSVTIALAVELASSYDRYPFGAHTHMISGHALPAIRLNAFEMSAPIKISIALARMQQSAPHRL